MGFAGLPSQIQDRFGAQNVMCFPFISQRSVLPRSLDTDLGAVLKAAEPFDWERIPFILEVGQETTPGKYGVLCYDHLKYTQ